MSLLPIMPPNKFSDSKRTKVKKYEKQIKTIIFVLTNSGEEASLSSRVDNFEKSYQNSFSTIEYTKSMYKGRNLFSVALQEKKTIKSNS